MTHFYNDISHFRAPYKNMAISGMGASLLEQPPGTPSPTDVAIDALLYKTDDGLIRLRPEVASVILKKLEAYNATFLSDTRVVVAPFTAAELAMGAQDPAAAAQLQARSAKTWLDGQVGKGRVVFGSIALALAAVPANQTELGSVAANDKVALAQIAQSDDGLKKQAPVFAAPSALASAAMSPVGLGLIAAAVAGGVYLTAKAMKKKKKSGGG